MLGRTARLTQRLDDHVTGCTAETKRTQEAVALLAKSLEEASTERRAQFDKLNAMLWKIAFAMIGGLGAVVYDMLKTKGVL